MRNQIESLVIDGIVYEVYNDIYTDPLCIVIKGLDSFHHINQLIDNRSRVLVCLNNRYVLIQFINMVFIDKQVNNESITVSYVFCN